jgi:translation initiation factor 1A
MPNLKGGKKYKSGKASSGDVKDMPEIDAKEGQTIGRIIKSLGDRNMMVFCNDGKERICHIRGGLSKKKCTIEVGDVVIISLRGEGMSATQGNVQDRGDILTKFDREHHRALKKMDGVNPKLFLQVETMDARQKASNVNEDDDCGFVIEHGSDEEDEDDEEGGLTAEDAKEARKKKKADADKKRAEARGAKESAKAGDNDDIDIDNI